MEKLNEYFAQLPEEETNEITQLNRKADYIISQSRKITRKNKLLFNRLKQLEQEYNNLQQIRN